MPMHTIPSAFRRKGHSLYMKITNYVNDNDNYKRIAIYWNTTKQKLLQ